MDYAYILASLPMLRWGEKPLVTVDEFRGSCMLLTEADAMELDRLLAGQLEECVSAFVREWSHADTQIRSAVARGRCENAGVEISAYVRPFFGCDMVTQKVVADALASKNPLAAERILDQQRWALVDEIAFEHPFKLQGVLAYAVKLTIAWRWAVLDQGKADVVIEDLIVTNLKDEVSMTRLLNEENVAR